MTPLCWSSTPPRPPTSSSNRLLHFWLTTGKFRYLAFGGQHTCNEGGCRRGGWRCEWGVVPRLWTESFTWGTVLAGWPLTWNCGLVSREGALTPPPFYVSFPNKTFFFKFDPKSSKFLSFCCGEHQVRRRILTSNIVNSPTHSSHTREKHLGFIERVPGPWPQMVFVEKSK